MWSITVPCSSLRSQDCRAYSGIGRVYDRQTVYTCDDESKARHSHARMSLLLAVRLLPRFQLELPGGFGVDHWRRWDSEFRVQMNYIYIILYLCIYIYMYIYIYEYKYKISLLSGGSGWVHGLTFRCLAAFCAPTYWSSEQRVKPLFNAYGFKPNSRERWVRPV